MEVKLCLKLNSKLFNYLVVCHCSKYSKYVDRARSGKSNFENDFRANHIETSSLQKFLLGLGSGVVSITDPRRGDMVAVMGESTGARAFRYMRSKMLESEEGKKILEDKPRISSGGVNLEKLKQMPEGTLGKAYSNFLERYKYSPDSRLAVRFVDDLELAYVAQRYREAHDLFHTILDMPTNMLGEVTVKWVEAIQTRLPMCVTGALFGPLRLAPKLTRTYCTRLAVVLDPELSEKLKNEMKAKHHPGRVIQSRVYLPKYLEGSIISVLKENNALSLFEEAMRRKKPLYRKLIPKEESERKEMLKNFKISILESLSNKELSEGEASNIVKFKMMRYERLLNAISKPTSFNKRESLIYLMARAPYEYASLINIFTEICGRDPSFKPSTIFDFGSGVGTVIWAASNVWRSNIAEYFAVDTSADMNALALSIIEPNKDKLLVKNVLQRQFLPALEADFDIVVCAFSLSHLKNYEDRITKLNSLWKKATKYLVIVENGTTDGFKIINEARSVLLQETTDCSFKCHVMAPCPHDFTCPKISAPKKRACCFLASYTDLKLKKEEKYDASPYSYVVFKKESRSREGKQWPRILSEPVYKKKRVICQICTADGKLEEVTFTKSKHGTEMYACARKSKWGDCLPAVITRNTSEE